MNTAGYEGKRRTAGVNRRTHPGYFRDGFPTVISALGYRWGWGKIQLYLRV